MVDESALVKVRNEFLHREFLTESVDPLDAVVRVAEDSDVSINPVVGDVLDPFL